jgi:putative flippase GtrA
MIRSLGVSVPVIYVLVQLLAYGIDVGLFSVVHFGFHFDAWSANIIAKVAAGCFALFTHRSFTFQGASSQPLLTQAVKYFALLLANSIAASFLLYILLLGLPNAIVAAKIVSDVILLAVSFLASKTLVFRPIDQNR